MVSEIFKMMDDANLEECLCETEEQLETEIAIGQENSRQARILRNDIQEMKMEILRRHKIAKQA